MVGGQGSMVKGNSPDRPCQENHTCEVLGTVECSLLLRLRERPGWGMLLGLMPVVPLVQGVQVALVQTISFRSPFVKS